MNVKDILKYFLNPSGNHNVCRLCLEKKDGTISINEVMELYSDFYTKSISLVEILNTITHTEIDQDDLLPSQICEPCVGTALSAFLFLKQCQIAKESLESCLDYFTNNIISMTEETSVDSNSLIMVLPHNNLLQYHNSEFKPLTDTQKEFNHTDILTDSIKTEVDEPNNQFNEEDIVVEVENIKKLTERKLRHLKDLGFLEEQKFLQSEEEICQQCGESFEIPYFLNHHQKTVHNSKDDTLICDLCGKMYMTRESLKLHKESHVVKICQICGKHLRNKRSFERHFSRCSGERFDEKRFFCDYCGGSWKTKQQLQNHVYGKHLFDKPFKCEICGKGFATKAILKGHGIVHTRERLWQCEVCSNRFVDKKALKLHMRLHSGEKPYPCHLCGERFLCTTRRIAHIQRKHMERSVPCHICGMKFHTRTNLSSHLTKVHYRIKKRKPQTLVYTITSADLHQANIKIEKGLCDQSM